MLKLLCGLLLGMCSLTFAQTTTVLTGSIAFQNGVGLNGYIQIQLGRASAVNTCGATQTLVGNSTTIIRLVGGHLASSPSFIPTTCLKPSAPYYVQIYADGKTTPIVQDNWYIPISSSPIDIGTFVKSNFGGPIVVAVPTPILSAPSQSQTITQPGGTNLTINGSVIFTGSTAGITATQFSVIPAQCIGANSFATGIKANGDANCSATSSGVTTWNGRSGTVVPTTGDYSYSQISGTPTLFFQNLYSNGTVQAQNTGFDFSSNFVLGTETSPSTNATIDLASVGTPGTYASPFLSLTTDPQGRVISATTATNPCGSFLGTSCSYLPGGIMMEWGTTNALSSGVGSQTVSYPIPFGSVVYQVQATTFGSVDRITFVSNVTTNNFTVNNNGSSAEAFWLAIGK